MLTITLGTQNGDGMHLLVITPEMFHVYGIVRGLCPARILNSERITDFAAIRIVGLLCEYHTLRTVADVHSNILSVSLYTGLHTLPAMVPKHPGRDRLFGSHDKYLHGSCEHICMPAN